jgi:predicted alpha/beta hydrolase
MPVTYVRTAGRKTRTPIGRAPEPERLLIGAADGFQLHAALFRPVPAADARRIVVISPATAVPQRFYFRFAHYLAQHGLTVLTWDYRGIGASRPHSLTGFRATLQDSVADTAAITHEVHRRFPAHRVTLLGHSIGGVLALVNPAAARIDRIVTVGAQTSYWRDWPARLRYWRFLDWHLFRPALTRLVGYFPGRRLNLGEDLPYDFALAWGRCWRERDGLLGTLARGRALVSPSDVVVVGVTDDDIGTRAALQRLHGALRARSVEFRWIEPRAYSLPAIGHFDLFRASVAARTWPTLLALIGGADERDA